MMVPMRMSHRRQGQGHRFDSSLWNTEPWSLCADSSSSSSTGWVSSRGIDYSRTWTAAVSHYPLVPHRPTQSHARQFGSMTVMQL
eukprot:scaffold332670_cov35-Attheya_sp.AAC.1